MKNPPVARAYIIFIIMAYLGTILAWFLAVSIMINWDFTCNIGFFDDAWEPVKNSLMFVAGGIFIFMSVKLFMKYKANKKQSALLLAIFNLAICASNVVEGLGNSFEYNELFNESLQTLTYVTFTWAIAFLFLFLQEIFAGSLLDRKNLRSQVLFFSLMGAAVAMLVITAVFTLPSVLTFVAMGLIMVVTIILSIWQISAAFKLVKKAGDHATRNGLLMIGISGILTILLLVLILLKAIRVPPGFEFDYLIPPMAVAISITMYLGYINPSKASPSRSP